MLFPIVTDKSYHSITSERKYLILFWWFTIYNLVALVVSGLNVDVDIQLTNVFNNSNKHIYTIVTNETSKKISVKQILAR